MLSIGKKHVLTTSGVAKKNQYKIRSVEEDWRRVELEIAAEKVKQKAEIVLLQAIAAQEKAEQEAATAMQVAEASEKDRREAIATQKNAKREAEKAKQKAEKAQRAAIAIREKAEWEVTAAMQVKKEFEKARQESIATQEKVEREAAAARQAEKAIEEKAIVAQEKAKSEEVAPAIRIYKGKVRLNLIRPVSVSQIKQCEEFLAALPNVQVVSTGGSASEGPEIVISVKKPLPLGEIISNNQLINKILSKGKRLEIIMNVPKV